ncbi:hypothetical protein PIB30_093569 [Stylosanthes scabra]|uniref:Uncharacterized protein n=1 Tax=Stylosanthes scabra TaxID=79078 RepID=A0ABU6TWL1_9FABA|nr:hypothetical protein [Stylosanthes scabra]
MQAMSSCVIKLMYDEAWPNWKAIPAATRARMFDKWAENFTWEKKHDELVKAIFNTGALKRFSGMVEDVRDRKEHLTQWCRPELKKALYHYWEIDEKYLHRQAMNKRNRASEKCVIYTGGSATPMQTKAKMLDRPMSMAEVFKQTHTLKANKEQFADKRSSDIWDDFTNNTTVATQQAAESGTNAEVDPDQVWHQTVSEPSEKMGVTGEQMHVGSSSAAPVPPLHPPAPPEDDDADYVDP